jgi:hypothetical protein
MTEPIMTALPKLIACATIAAAVLAVSLLTARSAVPAPSQTLKSPSDFASISDKSARSRAIFGEIGRLLTNPRCMNCHPAGEHPLQGNDQHEHVPPVWRGENGHFATDCGGCHMEHNFTLHEAASYQSIPGHSRWGLAPLSMAWEGKSLGEICQQIKDTDRNGGRDLALLQEHVAKDDLVGWAWHPGEGRDPAPGTQEQAGQLMQAWIDTGAACPK